MNMLKNTVLCVLVFVVLAIVVSYILPQRWSTQQKIVVDRPPSAIFPYIADLKRWHEWAIWYREKTPANSYHFEGPIMGAGARTSWDGPKIGKGYLVITRADEQSGIEYNLFFHNNDVKSTGTIALQHDTGKTLVTWTDRGELGANPIMRYVGLFMESMLGNDFAQSLVYLKALIEKSEPNVNP